MVDQAENQQNGHRGASSIGDTLMPLENLGKHSDIVREMSTASTNPEEFLPKAVLTKQERKSLLRYWWTSRYLEDDEEDESIMDEIVWYDVILSMAQDGRAREDVVEMVTGKPRGVMSSLAEKFRPKKRRRDMHKQEFETS